MKPGIHKDISIEAYHEDRGIVSSTGLKQAKKSSKSFAHYLIHGTENKPCFDFGNAFEIALIDQVTKGEEFSNSVAIEKDQEWVAMVYSEKPDSKSPRATNIYKGLKADFLIENEGKYIIADRGDESMETIEGMVEACMSDPAVVKLLSEAEYQTSLVWKHSNGLLLKTRPDLAKPKKGIILDVKSCKDASQQGFARDAAKHDYPLQAVQQIEGAEKTKYIPEVKHYFWLAVEKEAPYNHAIYEFQKDDQEMVKADYDRFLDRAAKVINDLGKKELKSYGENSFQETGILQLELPMWYRPAV